MAVGDGAGVEHGPRHKSDDVDREGSREGLSPELQDQYGEDT